MLPLHEPDLTPTSIPDHACLRGKHIFWLFLRTSALDPTIDIGTLQQATSPY